jgi:hypothetical protein
MTLVFGKRPNTAYTSRLLSNARERLPRLRRDLSEVGIRIGVACTKYRDAKDNGWTFPPLTEAREAWAQLYGPQCWDNADAKDGGTSIDDGSGGFGWNVGGLIF